MEMLKNVYYKLEENHQAGLSELLEELEAEGICRIVAGERNKSWQNREAVSGSHGDTVISDALLITDDCRLAEQAETEGIACLGISDSDGYFAGAAMVLPDLLDVDVQMLRECYCHFHGIPATIAEDGRLILRELAEEDVDMLCRIGGEDGMEYAFCGSQRKAGFTPEVLKAYCKEQYRLYGPVGRLFKGSCLFRGSGREGAPDWLLWVCGGFGARIRPWPAAGAGVYAEPPVLASRHWE